MSLDPNVLYTGDGNPVDPFNVYGQGLTAFFIDRKVELECSDLVARCSFSGVGVRRVLYFEGRAATAESLRLVGLTVEHGFTVNSGEIGAVGGAGLYIEGGYIEITDSEFRSNSATRYSAQSNLGVGGGRVRVVFVARFNTALGLTLSNSPTTRPIVVGRSILILGPLHWSS